MARDSTNRFVAETAANLSTVRDRLAEVEGELPTLEARVRETSLEAALDDGAAGPHRQAVADLRDRLERVDTLRLALAEAERAEAERLASARSGELRAKVRALRQHLSRRAKAADDIETALQQYLKAWQAATDASAAAVALIAPSDPINDYHLLLEAPLSRRVEAELARVGYVNSSIGPTAWLPGVRLGALAEPHKTRPLAEELREVDNLYAAKFERTLGLAPPLPEPEPVERQSYTGYHPGTDLWYEARAAHLAQEAADDKPGIGCVLAYMPPEPTNIADEAPSEASDEPINPHEPGTPEAEEYARELALLRATATAPEDAGGTVIADDPDDSTSEPPAPADDQATDDMLHDAVLELANA